MRPNLTAMGLTTLLLAAAPALAENQPHNLILFVPDGLRAVVVTPERAPTLAAIRDQGVNFANSHSLFPTLTMPNASAMATGHALGDTGVFGNFIYTGYPVPGAGASVTPFLESDPVLGDVDEHFAGDYLDEVTLLKAAHTAGFDTAVIGKLGPALLFAHTQRSGQETIILDDATGSKNGIPLAPWLVDALKAQGLPTVTPGRGDNGKAGNATTPGTLTANTVQQDYFSDVMTKIILPKFKQDGKPFVAVFWSRDPDGSQHNQGDSLNSLTPGINGPTSYAAIRNADSDLARIRATLTALGLDQTTNIVVSADHGFSTIAKQSATSPAAKAHYADVPAGLLPPGFLAIDLATELNLPLADPDQGNAPIPPGSHPKLASGVLGPDPMHPKLVVAGNGGSDLIYLPAPVQPGLAQTVIKLLLAQDYVSGLFVDARLGRFPGTLPLSAINLQGTALTPMPAIVVNFRSFSTGCDEPLLCTAEIADTTLQQGQGMHGSFSRADTKNFMAAIGPDFKAGFRDPAPVSNADIGKTLAAILHLPIKNRGKLVGRVAREALPKGLVPVFYTGRMIAAPTPQGQATRINYQQLGRTRYFDAAGFAGRSVGLDDKILKK